LAPAQSGKRCCSRLISAASVSSIGPIVGAIFVTILSLGLSDLTPVWQLYFGLIFIAVVVFAPGGNHRLIDDAPSAVEGPAR